MKMLNSDEEEEEQLGAKQKQLRQRANESLQQLSGALEPDGEVVRGGDAAEEDKTPWSQKTQSEAVNQLKSLLLKQRREIPAPLSPSEQSPSKRVQKDFRASVSAYQDLVPTLNDQSDYIQHLEAEVKFCKDELQGLKQRVRVVVVENEKLQSELKSRAANESLKDYTILNSTLNDSSHLASNTEHNMTQRAEHKTWKNELICDLSKLHSVICIEQEQLKVIHQAQIESLEAQLTSLRKDLSVSQKECEELKVHLSEKRAADALRADGAPRVAGLCLKCAQHEAVLAGTPANLHVQAINTLTKERDELLVALHALKASHQEAKQKEWSACLQVQQAVAMAEEANLHKSRMEVQCEQLTREVVRQREQLEKEALALKARLAEARNEGRTEAQKQKEELAQTVTSLSQRVAELEGQLDRAHREKKSLTNQLEETLSKLTNQEQDNAQVCMDLRYQLNQAKLKKEAAEGELRELNAKTSRQMEKAAHEVEKLSSELVGCQQHLEAVQKKGSQWQAEALSLGEQLADAQHQLHHTRQKRESAERAHAEQMSSAALSAQQREKELVVLLQKTEADHLQRVNEMDKLMSSQNSIIRKLKEECCKLGAKLEELSRSSRGELEQLALEKQHSEETLKSLRARCSDLEEQCVQHGRMHQRMKSRLQQLDRHCQSSAQQVCELLAKQNQLMQERNTLSEEMQNLRTKVQTHTSPTRSV